MENVSSKTTEPDQMSGKISSVKQNIIWRAILRHYGNTNYSVSQEQLEREKYLIGKVKFNPWILMPAAVIVQFCCGSLYAWSVFNTPIDTEITGDAKSGKAPIAFYIALGSFGTSAATMGPWLERNGPKKSLFLSSSLFFLGNLISGLAVFLRQMWLLYIGFGIIGGFGLGLGYISPISSLQKWFPHRRGLAAGFAVCGFGAGSIAIAKVILPLIRLVGLPLTFVVLGSCYFCAMISSATLFRVPPPGFPDSNSPSDVSNTVEVSMVSANNENAVSEVTTNNVQLMESEIKLTLIESLKSVDFLLLYIMFFGNVLFDLLVISRLSNIVTQLYGKTPDNAATIVSINGIFNLLGRISFSTISDKIGRKTTFLFLLTTQTIVIAAFPVFTESKTYWAFLLGMFSLTACYGGGFGVIPAFLCDMFGSTNIGTCHGLILTAATIAGVVGGLTFTAIYNSGITNGYSTADAYPYIINSYWVLFFVIAGLISGIFVRTTLKDRLLPPVPGQIFRFRWFGRVIRITKIKPYVTITSSEEYDKEWEQYLQSIKTPQLPSSSQAVLVENASAYERQNSE